MYVRCGGDLKPYKEYALCEFVYYVNVLVCVCMLLCVREECWDIVRRLIDMSMALLVLIIVCCLGWFRLYLSSSDWPHTIST